MADNPYHTDYPGVGPFYGRGDELDLLERAVARGRRSIAAVMGGRGMGKTSFAIELQRRLHEREIATAHLIRHVHLTPETFLNRVGTCLASRSIPSRPSTPWFKRCEILGRLAWSC